MVTVKWISKETNELLLIQWFQAQQSFLPHIYIPARLNLLEATWTGLFDARKIKYTLLHFTIFSFAMLFLTILTSHTSNFISCNCKLYFPSLYLTIATSLFIIATLKGSYDAFLKTIILCIWCNRICRHALMFKKHIIFQILYIIVCRLCAPPLSHSPESGTVA